MRNTYMFATPVTFHCRDEPFRVQPVSKTGVGKSWRRVIYELFPPWLLRLIITVV